MATKTADSARDELAPRPGSSGVFRSYINGKWSDAGAPGPANTNPADTRDVLGHVQNASADETNRAIESAKNAFEEWRATPAPTRAGYLWAIHKLITRDARELAAILTLEEGKIFSEALGEVQKSLNLIEFMAGEGRRIAGETLPSEMPATFCYTVRQPLGAVGLITPWNFPVAIPIWKVAPALVAGNTVVLKPATLTPWTAVRIVELFHEAGLPPGVLNLVIGRGSEVGDTIVNHPDIKAVSFTGSNDVGAGLYAQGARRLLKVQCEMGGKNPVVVLEDADLDLAVTGTAQGAFGSTGQRCTATSRAIVMDGVADEFVERLAAKCAAVVSGNGMRKGVTMGPSVDEKQMKTVLDYIEIGKREGARLVSGGARATGEDLDHGFFVQPTIFDGVSPGMRIAQEEIFGPVIAVIRVKTFEEAMEAANGVAFGLSSSIYSNDNARIFRFLDRIETGITHVNSPTMGGEAQLPFGGMKGTGVGPREQGKEAVQFFTELKTVYVDYTGRKRDTNIY
jgi:acyl-CoA reductase-like NAD-dependent aldehyde dehydrogenase